MHNILLLRVASSRKKYNALCPVLQWSFNHFSVLFLSSSIFSSLLSLTGTITKHYQWWLLEYQIDYHNHSFLS
jgi:hypothetical protein